MAEKLLIIADIRNWLFFKVLEEMEEYVPRLFARRSLIERTLGKLNKEAQMFLRNVSKTVQELRVDRIDSRWILEMQFQIF